MNNCHFRMIILAAIGMDWMWRKLEQGNFKGFETSSQGKHDLIYSR